MKNYVTDLGNYTGSSVFMFCGKFKAFKIEVVKRRWYQKPIIYGSGNWVYINRETMKRLNPLIGSYYCEVIDIDGLWDGYEFIYGENMFEDFIKSGYIKEIT